MTDHDADSIPGLVELLRVKPGSRVRLPADFDPGARLGVRKKDDGLSLRNPAGRSRGPRRPN